MKMLFWEKINKLAEKKNETVSFQGEMKINFSIFAYHNCYYKVHNTFQTDFLLEEIVKK